jgi:hypothetical protein
MNELVVNGGHKAWYTAQLTINKHPDASSFSVNFNRKASQSLSFQSAADYTAKTICEDFAGTDIYIGLSGGVDSEFVADVFYRNQIPFTPIISIMPGMIEHKYAFYWCKQRNITPLVYEFHNNADVVNIAASVLSRTPSYSFLHTLAVSFSTTMAMNRGGVFVAGEPDLTYKPTSDFYSPITDNLELIAGDLTSEFCFPGKKNPGGFYWYTPELVAATAYEIDPAENFDVARSKLYGVPYRPKQQQTRKNMYRESDIHKLIQIFKLDSMDDIPPLYWTKDSLYKALTD